MYKPSQMQYTLPQPEDIVEAIDNDYQLAVDITIERLLEIINAPFDKVRSDTRSVYRNNLSGKYAHIAQLIYPFKSIEGKHASLDYIGFTTVAMEYVVPYISQRINTRIEDSITRQNQRLQRVHKQPTTLKPIQREPKYSSLILCGSEGKHDISDVLNDCVDNMIKCIQQDTRTQINHTKHLATTRAINGIGYASQIRHCVNSVARCFDIILSDDSLVGMIAGVQLLGPYGILVIKVTCTELVNPVFAGCLLVLMGSFEATHLYTSISNDLFVVMMNFKAIGVKKIRSVIDAVDTGRSIKFSSKNESVTKFREAINAFMIDHAQRKQDYYSRIVDLTQTLINMGIDDLTLPIAKTLANETFPDLSTTWLNKFVQGNTNDTK